MSNIIRSNETAPNDEWIIMSNQGTDCFLDLLITAADDFEKTEQQQELISFLKDQKDINTVAPGTAGFDLDEMAWQESTLKEDVEFLIRVTKEAQRERTFRKLPYEINTGIVISWLERFAFLIDQMTAENLRVKSEVVRSIEMKENIVQKLTSKDDKYACAFTDRIVAESHDTDEWYEYFEDVASLLDHPKSLVRNRALYILAANAQWDEENRFALILPDYLKHITDEKPITARQCVKALAQVGLARPQYIPQILSALRSADLSKYKDSMRPLIERDIEETEKILINSNLSGYCIFEFGASRE